MAYLPPTKSLYLGGRLFDASEVEAMESGTSGVILYSQIATSGRWSTMRTANGSSGYQVPVGKTLTVKAAVANTIGGSVICGVYVLYGDTDVGLDSASAPTNPVYVANSSSSPILFSPTYTSVQVLPADQASYLNFQVPAGKYPCAKGVQAGESVIFYCTIA